MKKKVMQKALAGMLATTMVLSMSMTALAQTGDATGSGTGTGTGNFEGHVDKEVVAVTLPTAETSTFAYKMDPEGLIAATESAKYSGATFEEGANVYFQSSENNWTKDSAKLKVVNRGTVAVDVTIIAKTAANTDIEMATAKTFADTDTAAKLYLGLMVANQNEVAVDTTDTAGKVTVGLKGNDANYEITSTDSGYGYTVKAGVPESAWNSFEFGLTGACNPNGDYSAANLAASDVTVTWNYAVREDNSNADLLDENAVADAAPSIATTQYTATSGSPVAVAVNLGAGDKAATGIASIRNLNNNTNMSEARYSLSGSTLTFDATFITNNMSLINSANGLRLNVIFNDAAKTSVTITLIAATQ